MNIVLDKSRDVPNRIDMFFHCAKCIDEGKERFGKFSPRRFARLEAGFTPDGIQIRCVRHDINVVAFNFVDEEEEVMP